MLKKGYLLFLLLFVTLIGGVALAQSPIKAKSKKNSKHPISLHSKVNRSKSKKIGKKKSSKHPKKYSQKHKKNYKRTVTKRSIDTVRRSTVQVIEINKEKSRLNDSIHLSILSNSLNSLMKEEGYFANTFSAQKKTASLQTLEGTAAIFKSLSGWQDKKFYILTNDIPIGTIVKITTADLKSIYAKVINALPEMSNSIQYRLSDAAVAILGITNKTFHISVSY